MNKTRQQELTRWLKQQSVISRRWLMMSRLLGVVSGVLIVAQAWILAKILNHMIMENIPREALLLPFALLVLIFVLRSWVVWLRERVGFHAGVTSVSKYAVRCSTGYSKPVQRGFRVNPQAVGLRLSLSKLTICMISMHVICLRWRWPPACRC
jgi:ABC-type multidrug transport system fused ATPase/permease subunit